MLISTHSKLCQMHTIYIPTCPSAYTHNRDNILDLVLTRQDEQVLDSPDVVINLPRPHTRKKEPLFRKLKAIDFNHDLKQKIKKNKLDELLTQYNTMLKTILTNTPSPEKKTATMKDPVPFHND